MRRLSEMQVVCRNGNDGVASVTLAAELRAGIPGARLECFLGGHLFLLFAQRQRFLDAVSSFLGG
jgi:hypothetical protein